MIQESGILHQIITALFIFILRGLIFTCSLLINKKRLSSDTILHPRKAVLLVTED